MEEPREIISMEDLVLVVARELSQVEPEGYSGGSSGRDHADSYGGGGVPYNTGTFQQN